MTNRHLPALLALCFSFAGADTLTSQIEEQHGSLGSKAQEFLLEDPFGGTVRFPDRSSGAVDLTVVMFWATWSQPSTRELERLEGLWEKWSRHKVQIIAVNVEDSRIDAEDVRAIRARMTEHPLPFPVVMDRGLSAFHAYGVVAVPTTLVVDSSGTIVYRLAGYPLAGAEELVDAVERLVVESVRDTQGTDSEWTPGYSRAIRYTRLANLLAAKGEFKMAEYTLQQAIESDATFLEARLELARLFENEGRHVEAEALLLKATADFPSDCDLILAQAELKLRQGDLTKAEEFVQSALDLNPESSQVLIVQARVRMLDGDYQSALPILQQAVNLNPLDFHAYVELGKTLEVLDDKLAAIESYEKAYQILDPTWIP